MGMLRTTLGEEPVADDTNVEEMGVKASQLKQMQVIINAPQTGRFDEATFDALKEFQRSTGLTVSGYPNAETIAMLKKMGGGAMADLTWWDWTLIYLFEYKWAAVGVGIGAVGGIGYWLWRRSKRRT